MTAPSATASAVACLLGLAACAASPGADATREELLAADRTFATATAEAGVDGWLASFAEDGMMIQAGEEVRGHAAIRQAMTPLLPDSSTRLTWEPLTAEASPDGALGYTIGRYRIYRTSNDSVLTRGTYLTVWRRTGEGWRVAVDIGSPEP